MATAVPRVPVPAPAFIRMLARLADSDPAPSGRSPADQLGQWIDWSRAVALSRALDGPLQAPAGMPQADASGVEECARVRASLAASIASPRIRPADPAADAATATADGYAPWRQHCLSMQRSMLAASGRLRGQLRERLAGTAPEMARLAEVDAVMEGALGPREQTLLANVPTLLGLHFERLRKAAGDAPPGDASANAPWLDRFQRDLQAVLLAELDFRFQPVDALLAALRPYPTASATP